MIMIKPRKETLKDGRVVWRARGVSVGKDPVTGKRAQRTITCGTRRELEAELSKLGYQIGNGTYRAPWHGLVPELIDSYLASGAIEWEANTQLSYRLALQPAREWFAHRKAKDVTREQVQEYRDHLRTAGRRRGGTTGTGLSPRSVNLALGQLQAAYELAERDGKVAVNPVRFVKRVKAGTTARGTWGEDELRQFITAAGADRLSACWLLSLLGLRRSEVLGLMWPDVSFEAGTITIRRARVLVNGRELVKGPKSARSGRTLPLFEPVTSALEALKLTQMDELAAAGAAYANSNYVCCDELGLPLGIEWYSDKFHRIAGELPRIRLHDCRASVNSYLEKLGVSDSLRSMWLGHTVQVNRTTYLRAQAGDLDVISDALNMVFQTAV
jgi:integrase